ncbi:diguanylate cyclase [Bengtsoniella intestinalis]|uniref:sensor domain-containing diguanylate cyclase n=1 Tax=Bengtsoniella intestinalis TaxID=3073143 RepID=UPI00391F64B7
MFIVFLILTFFINWGVRYKIEESRFVSEAESLFWQIDQIIEDNDESVAEIVDEFSQQCLTNALTAAYMAEANPELYTDIDALAAVAELLGVDEIHFFDTDGNLYFGTHPEYYGYSFSSGSQMGYFLPMLEDASLMLCQDITPNTAESKPMQYAAVWNENGTGIVQIGVTPDRVLAVQEGNDISDVFDMMPISDDQIFLAIDQSSCEIVGSTSESVMESSVASLGTFLSDENISAMTDTTIGDYVIDGQTYLYLIHHTDELVVVDLYEKESIMESVTVDSIIVSIYVFLFAVVFVIFITIYLNRKIIRSIITINSKLERIEQGDLSVTMVQNSVPEIRALSDHINSMVRSLINQAHKLSMALDLAQIPTGIVEYDCVTQKITATGKVREILHLSLDEYNESFRNADTLALKLKEIREINITEEKNILWFKGSDIYIKMESFQDRDSTLVLLMDISKEIQEKEIIKQERDTDILTGLYNRRAFYYNAEQSLSTASTPYYAICMIDLDNLKTINDVYGHEVGDVYIKSIADMIFFEGTFIAGRLGGDEFAVLLYNAPSEEALQQYIRAVEQEQDSHTLEVTQGNVVPLAFSMGCAFATVDDTDYINLIKIADHRMYQNKCSRKGSTQNIRYQG